ncbi:MAG: phenylalanine--tRNA ligase subunit beta, partial [Candidatus Omnitrophica bacterium]|nr:phenylalanine--tRNA ligase subunit beta [Candidatus Omnitrophota bacterium]
SREKIRVSKIKDIGRKEEREKLISLNPQRLNNFLGKEIPPSEIEKIFSRLGFSVRKKKDFFIIKPPLFRRDIEREEDLIEEIARLHGYEKIPLTFPESRKIPSLINEDGLRRIEKIVYEVLTGLGFNETITYSLVSRESLQKVNFQNEESWIKVSNPLSKAQEFLRPTLLVSLLEVVAYNLKHQKDSVKIFEWGKIYLVKETPREIPSLGLCLSGESFLGWLKKKEKLGFYTLKGVVETIFSQLGIKEVDFLSQEKPFFIPAYSAEIKFKGESLGFLGKIKEDIQNNFDLPLEAFFAEIDLTQLTKFASFAKRYVNLPKFPFILRDISFLVDAGINYGDLRKFFQEFPSPLIQEINLIDLYRGENIPAGKNSFTFSLKFQSPERTLREEEVEEVMREIRQGLKEKFSAEIR